MDNSNGLTSCHFNVHCTLNHDNYKHKFAVIVVNELLIA